MKSVFVQIASYRDPQLIPTLKDLIIKSSLLNLKICVCWQHDQEQETLEDFLDAGFDIFNIEELDDVQHNIIVLKYDQHEVRLIDVPYLESQGACWARNYIQRFYNSEDYTLQLDSHHRFVDSWDKILLDVYEELKGNGYNPLITAYLPAFDPDDPSKNVLTPWRMNFDRFTPEGVVFFMPENIPQNEFKNTRYIPSRFYSAHFAFADGEFSRKVKHDPYLFFHGEEISIAARAYTHGYDLFHPNILIAWHEYTRKNRNKIWDDHTPQLKDTGKIKTDWVQRNNNSLLRNRKLFSMDGEKYDPIVFGEFGFGIDRSLEDYERYAGICFKSRSVTIDTLNKKIPDIKNTDKTLSMQDWSKKLRKSNDVRILFRKCELDIIDDCLFVCVAAHDADGNQIYRRDWTSDEYNSIIKSNIDWVDRRIIFIADRQPKTYTVWPYSQSKGWCQKIVKTI